MYLTTRKGDICFLCTSEETDNNGNFAAKKTKEENGNKK